MPDSKDGQSRDLASLMGLGEAAAAEDAKQPAEEASLATEAQPEVELPKEPAVSYSERDTHHNLDSPGRQSPPVHGPDGQPVLWMDDPKGHNKLLESLRVIKNELMTLRKTNNQSIFMFTGPGRRVGVSTVISNLAVVLALDFLDQNIVLVDANLSTPSLHTVFGVSQERGLMEFLLQDQSLEDTVKRTRWPNLDVVSTGKISQNVASPFDLDRLPLLLSQLKHHYHLILVDAAPLLMSSNSRVFAPKVDGVIIIAAADESRWEVLQELSRQVEDLGAQIIGGVLNKRRFVIPSWVYKFV